MSAQEFILIYSIGGVMTFAAGYLVGKLRAEDDAARMRRWWFNRHNKGERK
jgi:hypothetical protein